jgi:hypothetical protein
MAAAIKQTVTVGPGGLVQFRSPQLQAGTQAEVIVLVPSTDQTDPTSAQQSLASFVGAGKGGFATVEEADKFIRSERDEWDR